MGGRVCRAVVVMEDVEAEALAAALEPDNAAAPPGVEASCRAGKGTLVCVVTVNCQGAREILRLRNTLDDLVLNLRAALEAIGGGKR